jgi:hypothetical protein
MGLKIPAIRALPWSWSRVIDRIEYAAMSVRFGILDRFYGPEPATWADQRREAEHERLQRAFPAMDLDRKRSKYWVNGPI